MKWPSLAELRNEIVSGKRSAVEMVEQSLRRLEETAEYFTILDINERALIRAKEIDTEIAQGKIDGKLLGIPYIAKDNFLTHHTKTTAASNILTGFESPYQATAIELLEREGAIMLAKANLDAFAHGSSTENSDFGTTKNPHDIARVPGGSSGGSAAAVALDQVPFALGSDTGGSIRLPASFCGVVGYKPTYGLISRWGVVAMGSSTDVIGPLTNSVEDAAYILDILAHKDGYDATMIDRAVDDYSVLESIIKGKKVGVVKEFMSDELDKEVRKTTQATIDRLSELGAQVVEVSMPTTNLALACYYIVVPAEVSSNLARYDGVRFGYTSKGVADLDELYSKSRSEGFGPEAKRRILIGTYVLSSGYYDAYYKKAQQVRTMIVKDYARVFEEVDVLVGPTAPSVAFGIGENAKDPIQMYLSDIMTVSASLAGLPAVSIPTGELDGLPLGFQIIGQHGADNEVLSIAKQLEISK